MVVVNFSEPVWRDLWACDCVDLVQNGFCTRPVVPLQGSFGRHFATSPTVSRRSIRSPNRFSTIPIFPRSSRRFDTSWRKCQMRSRMASGRKHDSVRKDDVHLLLRDLLGMLPGFLVMSVRPVGKGDHKSGVEKDVSHRSRGGLTSAPRTFPRRLTEDPNRHPT